MKLLTGTLKEGLCEDFHKLMCVYTVYTHKTTEVICGAILQAYNFSRGQTGSVCALNIVMLLTISSVINRKMHK